MKEKLGVLVESAQKAKTVKDYATYKKAGDALMEADKEIRQAPSTTSVKVIKKEYQEIKEKCANWKDSKYKDIFSPETEKPFVDALKAIEKVGKDVETNGEITKEDLD